MFDQLKRAFGGDAEQRRANLEAEFARVSAAIEARRETLETLRRNRLHALFPDGAVAGSSGGHYPDLDPINFEEGEQDSWLVSVSTQIIDRFPGGDVLLSQLDRSLRAFSDANHFRVVPGGPYAELLGWRFAFVMLVPCPFLGLLAMARLRRLPDATRMAGGRR